VYRGSTTPSRDRRISPIAPRLNGPSRTRPRRTGIGTRSKPSRPAALSVRTVARIETGSSFRRRKQNSSTLAEGRSSHCVSSTAMTSGSAAERIRSASRIPRATTCRSGRARPASGVSRSSTVSTARLRGPWSAGRTSPATSPNRSTSAEKASGPSAEAGWQASTRADRPASWAMCFHTMVFPIPGSPTMTRARGVPGGADKKPRISAISSPRPIGSKSTLLTPPNRV
jgi:hypothetical protein